MPCGVIWGLQQHATVFFCDIYNCTHHDHKLLVQLGLVNPNFVKMKPTLNRAHFNRCVCCILFIRTLVYAMSKWWFILVRINESGLCLNCIARWSWIGAGASVSYRSAQICFNIQAHGRKPACSRSTRTATVWCTLTAPQASIWSHFINAHVSTLLKILYLWWAVVVLMNVQRVSRLSSIVTRRTILKDASLLVVYAGKISSFSYRPIRTVMLLEMTLVMSTGVLALLLP
jgi:hypothetical protein